MNYETPSWRRVRLIESALKKIADANQLRMEAAREAQEVGCSVEDLGSQLLHAKAAAWDEHLKNMIGRTVSCAPADDKEGA